MIILHPSYVARAGIGDIVRSFEERGFDISNNVGSRFFSVRERPVSWHVPQIAQLFWSNGRKGVA